MSRTSNKIHVVAIFSRNFLVRFFSIIYNPITFQGRLDTIDEFAKGPFHLILFSVAQFVLAKSILFAL